MIPVFTPSIGEEELRNVTEVIKSGWISSRGEYIRKFEEKFAEYCGVKYGVTTTSGTTAIHLALASLGIKPGDEVIVPNFTMISSALAVHYLGATPVFVDAEEETGNIDVSRIEEKITPRTRAIMPVHIYGHPCDMDEIHAIAEKYKLFVVEDAAEAHGAEYKGKRCGSLSDVGCFSFYGNKLITTGEGGMVVTDSQEIYERAQSLKDLSFRADRRYLHDEVGFNYRMTNVQAAIGLGQMEKIDLFLKKKIENAHVYSSILKDVRGVKIPIEKTGVKSSYWMYGVRFTKDFGVAKEDIKKMLFEKGIDTRDFFIGMNEQPIFRRMGLQTDEKFPVSKELSETGIYLPIGLDLKEEEIRHICEVIKEIGGQKMENNIPEEIYLQILENMPICCVDLIIHDDGKILLVRRNEEPCKNCWWFPGGRVYKNERLVDAAKRKAKEELGIDVEIERQVGIYEFFSDSAKFPSIKSGTHALGVVYLAKPVKESYKVKIDETSKDYQWFAEPPKDTLHQYFQKALNDSGVFH